VRSPCERNHSQFPRGIEDSGEFAGSASGARDTEREDLDGWSTVGTVCVGNTRGIFGDWGSNFSRREFGKEERGEGIENIKERKENSRRANPWFQGPALRAAVIFVLSKVRDLSGGGSQQPC